MVDIVSKDDSGVWPVGQFYGGSAQAVDDFDEHVASAALRIQSSTDWSGKVRRSYGLDESVWMLALSMLPRDAANWVQIGQEVLKGKGLKVRAMPLALWLSSTRARRRRLRHGIRSGAGWEAST